MRSNSFLIRLGILRNSKKSSRAFQLLVTCRVAEADNKIIGYCGVFVPAPGVEADILDCGCSA